ncbi:hypothetical protein BS47DRAFT_1397533 [Hydnum rufescens UP504]|uniref:Uncharacterized protein n=1 Tax=Hydnum rufescens UP504 TaxID=1448309 RepID=A0A9P6AMS6_9AGAM|nr:hypothetical protein BS47DRAFT_1397533 [Hydnum rufescens UP504]
MALSADPLSSRHACREIYTLALPDPSKHCASIKSTQQRTMSQAGIKPIVTNGWEDFARSEERAGTTVSPPEDTRSTVLGGLCRWYHHSSMTCTVRRISGRRAGDPATAVCPGENDATGRIRELDPTHRNKQTLATHCSVLNRCGTHFITTRSLSSVLFSKYDADVDRDCSYSFSSNVEVGVVCTGCTGYAAADNTGYRAKSRCVLASPRRRRHHSQTLPMPTPWGAFICRAAMDRRVLAHPRVIRKSLNPNAYPVISLNPPSSCGIVTGFLLIYVLFSQQRQAGAPPTHQHHDYRRTSPSCCKNPTSRCSRRHPRLLVLIRHPQSPSPGMQRRVVEHPSGIRRWRDSDVHHPVITPQAAVRVACTQTPKISNGPVMRTGDTSMCVTFPSKVGDSQLVLKRGVQVSDIRLARGGDPINTKPVNAERKWGWRPELNIINLSHLEQATKSTFTLNDFATLICAAKPSSSKPYTFSSDDCDKPIDKYSEHPALRHASAG